MKHSYLEVTFRKGRPLADVVGLWFFLRTCTREGVAALLERCRATIGPLSDIQPK